MTVLFVKGCNPDRVYKKLIKGMTRSSVFSLGHLKIRCLHRPSANCGMVPKWMQPVKYTKAANSAPFPCTREVPNSTPTRQVQVETRLNSVVDIFKIVREARNKGRAKFKLKQKKAQTKECSKQVTVNGDIFHQLASEREIPNATLETIPEEQTPRVPAVEHPQDKSYKMFFSKRTKPRKKKVLHVPAVKLPQGPFELSNGGWPLMPNIHVPYILQHAFSQHFASEDVTCTQQP